RRVLYQCHALGPFRRAIEMDAEFARAYLRVVYPRKGIFNASSSVTQTSRLSEICVGRVEACALPSGAHSLKDRELMRASLSLASLYVRVCSEHERQITIAARVESAHWPCGQPHQLRVRTGVPCST